MPMVARAHRCHLIERILGGERIGNQAELLRRLREHGVVITQATLSRDLSAIGVVKGPRGYQLASEEISGGAGDLDLLAASLREHLRWADHAGTLVVLMTPTGRASMLAVEIDRARLRHAVGTIAGDDTIFIACRDQGSARQLAEELRRLAGIDDALRNGRRRDGKGSARA